MKRKLNMPEEQEPFVTTYKEFMLMVDKTPEQEHFFLNKTSLHPETLTQENLIEDFQKLSNELKELKKELFKLRSVFLQDVSKNGELKYNLKHSFRNIPFLIRKPAFKVYAIMHKTKEKLNSDSDEFFKDLKNYLEQDLEALKKHYTSFEIDGEKGGMKQEILQQLQKSITVFESISEGLKIKKEYKEKINDLLKNGGRPPKIKYTPLG